MVLVVKERYVFNYLVSRRFVSGLEFVYRGAGKREVCRFFGKFFETVFISLGGVCSRRSGWFGFGVGFSGEIEDGAVFVREENAWSL